MFVGIETTSQQTNDCVIVAFANYFHMSYEDVLNELNSYTDWKFSNKGVTNIIWTVFLFRRGYRMRAIPRRGQDNMSGIACLKNPSGTMRHMVIIERGIVFDSLNLKGMPIKEYRNSHTCCHIDAYWSK